MGIIYIGWEDFPATMDLSFSPVIFFSGRSPGFVGGSEKMAG